MTTDTRPWKLTHIELPDPKVTVETKIDDGRGRRNEAALYYERGFWFDPDSGVYMYYTPTHWRPLPEPAVTVTDAEVEAAADVIAEHRAGRVYPSDRAEARMILEAAARVRLAQ